MTTNLYSFKTEELKEKTSEVKGAQAVTAALTTLSPFTDNIEDDPPHKRRCRLAFTALTKSILPRCLSDRGRSREC